MSFAKIFGDSYRYFYVWQKPAENIESNCTEETIKGVFVASEDNGLTKWLWVSDNLEKPSSELANGDQCPLHLAPARGLFGGRRKPRPEPRKKNDPKPKNKFERRFDEGSKRDPVSKYVRIRTLPIGSMRSGRPTSPNLPILGEGWICLGVEMDPSVPAATIANWSATNCATRL
jgi:hypothetical protein